MNRHLATTALVATLATPLAAQTERELDSHEHGAAALDIVIDGDRILIDFRSPWNNLVGFEHGPGNDEERAAVADTRMRLEDPASVIGLDAAANCSLDSADTADTMGTDTVTADAHEHDHAEGEAEADVVGDGGGEHSEFAVSYAFTCGDIEALDGIDVQAGDTWDGIEDLDVRMVGPNGQSATELEGGSGRIDLSPIS